MIVLLLLALRVPPAFDSLSLAQAREGGSYEQGQPPRDARAGSPANATGSIAGIVTTDDAPPRPLRRARVTLNGAGLEMGRTAITAEDGTFAFDGVPPGRFTIAASKDAYVTMNYGASRPQRPGIGVQVAERQTTRIAMRLPRGAVITGTVVNVDGEPAAGISVSVLARRVSTSGFEDVRYANAGTPSPATTDDRGVYRIYGIAGGDYVVSAQPQQGPGAPAPATVRMMSRGAVGDRRMQLSQVFYPRGTDVTRASRVTVRAGEERPGVDIQLEYVPLAVVSGTANVPGGFGPARVTLWQLDELARPRTGPVATADGAGRFQFPPVAPGQYRVTARAAPPSSAPSGRGASPGGDVQYATAEIVVDGEDVDVGLSMQPGLSISGRVVFESDRESPALPDQFRVTIPALAISSGGWPLPQLVLEGARFRMDGIIPGVYRTSPNAQAIRTPVGAWWLKSLTIGGRDLLDSPLQITQSETDVVATFTDKASVVTGAVTDASGAPMSGLTVVAFSTDRAAWFFNSRRIAAVRLPANGRYTFQNLPSGEYRIVATGDLEPNEWFDPSALERLLPAATPFTIEGVERKTVDLRPR